MAKRRRTRKTRKGTRKSRKGVKRTKRRTFKKKPVLKRVVSKRPHRVLDRTTDRDHLILTQRFSAPMDVDWVQGLTVLGGSTDGFLISMNSVSNTFQMATPPVFGPLHYGVPVVGQITTGYGLKQDQGSSTGSFLNNTWNPDGVRTALARFQQLYVTGGVFTITVSQDTQGVGTSIQGSTRVAVCGFPSPPTGGDVLQNLGNGHWVYPFAAGIASTLQLDSNSMQGLLNEPNCRSVLLTPFAGSKTRGTIRYPFTMNKYAPPGYWTSSSFFLNGPNGSVGELPNQLLQPRILVQLESNGAQALQVYRFDMSMTWHVTAFERNPVINIL